MPLLASLFRRESRLSQPKFYKSSAYNRSLDALLCRAPDCEPDEIRRLVGTYGCAVGRGVLCPADVTALFRNLRVFDDWRGSCDHPTLRKADPNALTLWEAEYRGHFILAPLIRMILESPIYRWMAAISALDEIAIPLSHTMFRRVHDNAANDWWGLHQDHSAVNPDVPFNVWLPLEPCSPDQRPTLGFWAGIVPDTPKRRALDARCSARPDRIWLPSYASGDVALFTNRTPHMTTGFNTGALRWSAELRYMDPRKIPEKMAAEPFLIVTRGDRGFDLSRMTFRNLPEPVLQYMTSTECRLPIL